MFPHMDSVHRPDGFSEGDFSLEIIPTPGTVLVGNDLLDLLVVWLEDFLHILLRLGDTLRPQAVIQPHQQLHGVLHPGEAEGVERVLVPAQEMVVEESVRPQPVAQYVSTLLAERGHKVLFPGVELDKCHLESNTGMIQSNNFAQLHTCSRLQHRLCAISTRLSSSFSRMRTWSNSWSRLWILLRTFSCSNISSVSRPRS